MKKLLLILAVALSSCEPEENKCDCKGKFLTPQGQLFYMGLKVDCETMQPSEADLRKVGGYFIGCE